MASADASSAARQPEPVAVELPITLGQFLKLAGVAATGGDAKNLISSGGVRVNGDVETRRGRDLQPGDTVEAAPDIVLLVTPGGSRSGPQPL